MDEFTRGYDFMCNREPHFPSDVSDHKNQSSVYRPRSAKTFKNPYYYNTSYCSSGLDIPYIDSNQLGDFSDGPSTLSALNHNNLQHTNLSAFPSNYFDESFANFANPNQYSTFSNHYGQSLQNAQDSTTSGFTNDEAAHREQMLQASWYLNSMMPPVSQFIGSPGSLLPNHFQLYGSDNSSLNPFPNLEHYRNASNIHIGATSANVRVPTMNRVTNELSNCSDPFPWQNQTPQNEILQAKKASSTTPSRKRKDLTLFRRQDDTASMNRKKVGRSGPLTPEKRKSTHKMRSLGVCGDCRRTKQKCSPDHFLDNSESDGHEPEILPLDLKASRPRRLSDYASILSPPPLWGHLVDEAVKTQIERHIGGWTSYYIEVGLFTNLCESELRLPIRIFVPPCALAENGGKVLFTAANIPVAIVPDSEALIRTIILEYLDKIFQCQKWPGHFIGILRRFHDQMEDIEMKEQLHDVLVLYELQRLQAKSIYLTEKSVSDIIALSPRTKLIHPTKINIARSIINLQIRSVIARLIDEGVPRVFKVLENKLIRKENLEKKWGLCFALLTMICFLAEKVHDSLEGYRLFLKDNHYHEPQNPHPLMHYAQELEKHVIRACIRQFHAFFKSGALHSGKRGIKLNPIQDTSSDYSSMGQASVELVNSIREFIDQNGDAMRVRNEESSSSPSSNNNNNKHRGRGTKNVQGKFVASWLLSFCKHRA